VTKQQVGSCFCAPLRVGPGWSLQQRHRNDIETPPSPVANHILRIATEEEVAGMLGRNRKRKKTGAPPCGVERQAESRHIRA